MIAPLVADLLSCAQIGQIILTCNVPELLELPTDTRILTLENTVPMGFAANHNTAFKYCALPYYCVLNPDIRLQDNPFPSLFAALEETGAAIAAPLVQTFTGELDDNVRTFPTMRSLVSKALGRPCDNYKINRSHSHLYPDWIAGMFMLFRSDDFRRLQGFDERFFLYYEDVDICARAWKAGMKVVACPSVSVVHDAQRTSHRNFRYMRWHLASMARYFYKHWGRLPALPTQR
ncbi:MAG: glycosyltransferase family 2 protein [Desulfobulbus sp.]|nr:glycosyltransferase family 2 protein [Desulfobulbus sp.]